MTPGAGTGNPLKTLEHLTALLAERVMCWKAGPDRFLIGNRCWRSRSSFRPTERVQDAFKLLLTAKATEYSMGGGLGELFWAKVRIGMATGSASAGSLPFAICLAIARALGIEAGHP